MRAFRLLPVVLVGLGCVACTALLGDFEIGGASSGTDGGDDASAGGPVTITPGDQKLGILRAQTFTATGGDVTWSVQEGPAGGTIDEDGTYVSPATPGVYHVVATSKSDPAESATATVTVVPLGISLLAGIPGGEGNIDGPAQRAHFNRPEGLAVVHDGNLAALFIADTGNHTIRKLERRTSAVTTIAGAPGVAGRANGEGTKARFNRPMSLLYREQSKTLFVADTENHCIRAIDVTADTVSTLSGSCSSGQGYVDGADGASSRFGRIEKLALSPSKEFLYVCESGPHTGMRRVAVATGATTTVQVVNGQCDVSAEPFWTKVYFTDGTGKLKSFTEGDKPDYVPGSVVEEATLPQAYTAGLSVHTSYSPASVYYLEQYGSVVRRYNLEPDHDKVDLEIGHPEERAHVDGPFATARFRGPSAISLALGYDELFVADRGAHAVRKLDVRNRTVSTAAGAPPNTRRVDGARNVARFTMPFGITTDESGAVYVGDIVFDGDEPNSTIRRYDPASASLATLSGIPTRPFGDQPPVDGPKDQARFWFPIDLVHVDGNLYVVDSAAQAVRRVSATTGEVKTIAGELGAMGDADGVGAAARFKFIDPQGGDSGIIGGAIATDGTHLFVADTGNFRIRKIVLATGEVTTLAGGEKGAANGVGAAAQFMFPAGLSYADGMLYVADMLDHTIRRVDVATGEVTSFIGLSGQLGEKNGDASTALFDHPGRVVADGLGNLYVVELPFGGEVKPARVRRIDLRARTVSPFAGTPGAAGFQPGPLPSTLNCPVGLALSPTKDLVFSDVCDGVVAVIQAL
jgi:hypothetical protein